MARGSVFKNDSEARHLWGEEAYAAIPKSVFAVACWHLATLAGDGEAGGAARRLAEELEALGVNCCIGADQAKRAIKVMINEGMLS